MVEPNAEPYQHSNTECFGLSPAIIVVGDWQKYLPPLVAALKPVLGHA